MICSIQTELGMGPSGEGNGDKEVWQPGVS